VTALATAIDARATLLQLDVPVAAPYGTRISLEDESLSVVGGDGTRTLVVWRAQDGTKAVAHPAGTVVDPVWYGIARWPVTMPANSALKGAGSAQITMPQDGSVRITSPLFFAGLPTVDPHVAGQVWSNKGVLNVSAG
jgi:hypothetical protein